MLHYCKAISLRYVDTHCKVSELVRRHTWVRRVVTWPQGTANGTTFWRPNLSIRSELCFRYMTGERTDNLVLWSASLRLIMIGAGVAYGVQWFYSNINPRDEKWFTQPSWVPGGYCDKSVSFNVLLWRFQTRMVDFVSGKWKVTRTEQRAGRKLEEIERNCWDTPKEIKFVHMTYQKTSK